MLPRSTYIREKKVDSERKIYTTYTEKNGKSEALLVVITEEKVFFHQILNSRFRSR